MTLLVPPASDEDRANMLDAATALLGLPPETTRRTEVLFHMKLIGDAARTLLEFPLDDAVEIAAVFEP